MRSINDAGGLSSAEAMKRQKRYGKNEPVPRKKENFIGRILHVLAEPMFLLLLAAAVIYFIFGEPRDGAIMLVFVVGIIGIDGVQQWKTDKTLNALKDLSAPRVTVLRDGGETQIDSVDLVPGDWMLIHEGVKIPADGVIIKCNDLCVDESSLTGEAEGIWKRPAESSTTGEGYWRRDRCYAGTLVTQGCATVRVEKIGTQTEYGKIGAHVAAAPEENTPLQKQVGGLVKLCTGLAGVLFVLVSAITYIRVPHLAVGSRLVESVLSGITLAMAMIPEEFPVILTVFLSMGAWRLAGKRSLVRRLSSVETLGAVSVLCVDKTGTITLNRMAVQEIWASEKCDSATLTETMGLACETDAYDPMEKAMLAYCERERIGRDHLFAGTLLSEYPFTSELKMMAHVWRHDGELIVAAKGSPERLLALCKTTEPERKSAEKKLQEMSGQGLRVIAVARALPSKEEEIPAGIEQCELTLCGLVGLADPPRENVEKDVARCREAGIRVVMITGDNGATASAVARKIGIDGGSVVTGDMLNAMSEEELREAVKTTGIFSRVVPEHKMRIVRALKDNGEIVAMTGDGVNDAPALKYADIGIAMGKRGSEVSREAADLILMDDNFSTIVDTVKDGRRIYDNIRRAVGYVFAIHIPIALASLLAPMLGVTGANLMLLPLHVVLLELIIDPTCSIVLERQPAEEDIMRRPPRDPKEPMLSVRILVKSVLQGLAVFAASFGSYYFILRQNPGDAPLARTMGIAVIMLANLFLVLVNSSERESVLHSLRGLSHDRVMGIAIFGTFLGLPVLLWSPLHTFFAFEPLTIPQLLAVVGVAAASVLWYEIVKLVHRTGGSRGFSLRLTRNRDTRV